MLVAVAVFVAVAVAVAVFVGVAVAVAVRVAVAVAVEVAVGVALADVVEVAVAVAVGVLVAVAVAVEVAVGVALADVVEVAVAVAVLVAVEVAVGVALADVVEVAVAVFVAVAVALGDVVAVAVAVFVAVAVALGEVVGVALADVVAVAVGVAVAVLVAVAVAVAVGVADALEVEVVVGEAVEVFVAVAVEVAVAVAVNVAVAVLVAVAVAVGVGVGVAVTVGVGVVPTMPSPSSLILSVVSFDEVELYLTFRSPFTFFFGLVGVNVTPSSHVAPPASVAGAAGQVLVTTVKSDEAVMESIVTATVADSFTMSMSAGGLVRPTITLPKFSLFGSAFNLAAFTFILSGDAAPSDCADTGRANAVSRNNIEKVRPTNDRVNDLSRNIIRFSLEQIGNEPLIIRPPRKSLLVAMAPPPFRGRRHSVAYSSAFGRFSLRHDRRGWSVGRSGHRPHSAAPGSYRPHCADWIVRLVVVGRVGREAAGTGRL